MAMTLREQVQIRLDGMKNVRIDIEEECREIARFAQPARTRFMASDKDKGTARRIRNKRLLDPHGIECFRILTNGMTSGLSSASRPWFSLTVKDESLANADGVRPWLAEVERRMYAFLARTNFYGSVKGGYGEMGLFGTEGCVMLEHSVKGAVCHPLTFGEYWIALSSAGTPDTLYRRIPMNVRTAVQEFGDAVSPWIRTAYDQSNYTGNVEVYQAIEPNDDFRPDKIGSKPFRSVYWEGGSQKERALLRVSGMRTQPFWAPRWDVMGGDTYGVSPGMDALPALRELQMQAKRRNELIDQLAKPETVQPANVRITGQPGNRVSAPQGTTRDTVFPAYEVPPQAIQAVGGEIEKNRTQVEGLSYSSLFQAITNMEGVQPRNMDEIAARNEEKLMQLGPTIERVNDEKLGIAIDRTFDIMLHGGMLPEPPQALAGVNIDVEWVSILAQMQRMVGMGQIERVVGFVGSLAAAYPEAADKIDADATIDEYAYRAGAPVRMLRSDDDVAAIRAQRAQQQQQQQMVQSMPAVKDGAEAAQLLSQADVGGGQTLLNRMMPA
ncbi:portal protein [Novosphingobium rosa]|uniref:portal protein n=1 Tax=Novosphingobium rosa TaxID=76978 RepID=UPI000AEE2E93|nr:portal protein [Novosphingobium rosa]